MSLVGIFMIAVIVSLVFLYSGTGSSTSSMAEDKEYMILAAVPSDAAAVFKSDEFSGLLDCVAAEDSPMHYFMQRKQEKGGMYRFLSDILASSSLYRGLMSSAAVISVHDIGELVPLLTIDAGKAGDDPSEEVSALLAAAHEAGLAAGYEDLSDACPVGSPLRRRSILLVSPSDILVQSSLRHLKAEVSVLDADGVSGSAARIRSGDFVIVTDSGAGKIAGGLLSYAYRGLRDFPGMFSSSVAFSIDACSPEAFSMTGRLPEDDSQGEIPDIYGKVRPSVPEVSSVLPSYTLSAATVPLPDVSAYADAYLDFAETRELSRNIKNAVSSLSASAGIAPADWAEALELKEVAVASFMVSGKKEKVLLARPGKQNPHILFKGSDDAGAGDSEGKIHEYSYRGFLSALFGPLFSADDESCFTVKEGWMIVGSRNALSEYASGRALEYTLSGYLADAGIEDCLSCRNAYFASYVSLSEDRSYTASLFSTDFLPSVEASLTDISYEPIFCSVTEDKSGLAVNVDLFRTIVLKSQAPTFERDTEVKIPEGPFRVKNSGTGKWNLFYQQDNLYLCLQEEGGKGLWGVPFDAPICGCAQTLDYYANGKLQILFASGSKLYLIDRLGHYVTNFPVDLGKRILIGPDVYDFSGRKKYNVMILHTDNTIEMYNLQGRRPPQWKTITSSETIKGLPERIRVSGSTYWVVRTSIQTLIFGFYGGEPLTVFTGDRMIRPDSKITPLDNGSVEAVCYDGKRHTIRIVKE